MGVDAWERHRDSPGWVRDQFVALDHFHEPNSSFELTEAVVVEPVTYGKPSNEFYLSMMLNGDGSQSIEYDIGMGRFLRPNKPGSLVFADFMNPFSAKGRGPYHTVVLYLQRDIMTSRICSLLGRELKDLDSLYSSAFFDQTIEILFRQLLLECRRSKNIGGRLSQAGLVDAIIGRLASLAMPSTLSSNSINDTISVSDRIRSTNIDRVIDYMHAHHQSDLKRDDLAKIADVSPAHFSRLFKQTTGYSPKRFLMLLRLEKAAERLRNCREPETILETAKNCGFESESHFHEEFRKKFGVTPAVYQLSR
jgi:Transcriptional regulator containing an amidase domain and an AraC-type DNA-binding HTH domain